MASASTMTATRPTGRPTETSLQAFLILRVGFAAAPILFGLDKFTNLMTDWTQYLWSGVASLSPLTPESLMLVVGVIEITAGLLVLARPRIGGYVVAAWLAGIIVNLVLAGGFLDIALRDFGLLLGALALARLATTTRAPGEQPAGNPARR